jgi:hypothetical protein
VGGDTGTSSAGTSAGDGSTGTSAGSTTGTGGSIVVDSTSSGGSTTAGSDSTSGAPICLTSDPEACGSTGSTGTTGAATTTTGSATTTTTGSTPPPQAGLLTAGVWDDNRNYPWFTAYRQHMYASTTPGLLPLTDSAFDAANQSYPQSVTGHTNLDVAFVIDTTGSMGDELSYLQSEFEAIASTVATTYPNATPRWSVILYRDLSDVYVTRLSDFQSDAGAFQAYLAMQSAGGGGDIPEAPDKAFALVPQLTWRSDDATARMLFWVADAPHHAENAGAMATAIGAVQQLGVHIYPIASSGVDELTELTMRSAAALTHGRYIFLTNDSGIGGDHKEPSIPCYFVTKLDQAMLRMVDIEMTGVYREPAPSEILRTGGNPQSGACTTTDGQTVYVF